MSEPDCKLCRDEQWVCEEHPDQPWGHGGWHAVPVLQSGRRAGRATSATAGLQDHRGPEAWPASLTLEDAPYQSRRQGV
jgi:hypothetical protein